ncbi:DNA polymerase II [Ferrimonas senticii]|uniref:DNA polymerase II n=1 Tax=Ferrimonas senticii TaxID=394566 RepID=UPI0004008C4B|nr:DNA polymerase II [Ferrimonas senticii]
MATEQIVEGWILTREQRPSAHGAVLHYWLACADGARCVQVNGQPWQGFIAKAQLPQWHTLLERYDNHSWRIQAIDATDFDHQPQAALYIYDHSLWLAVGDFAKRQGLSLLERDIRPCDRYLMERFIRGGGRFRLLDDALVAAKPAAPTHLPTMVSLDVECSRDGVLYSIGLYGEDRAGKRLQTVYMVGEPLPEQSQPDYLLFVVDEASLLRCLLDWFVQHDPDAIIGWSVASFDLALLERRAKLHQLRFSLGRDGSEPQWQQRAGPGRECQIAGRLVLDGIEWLRAAFYQFESFALDNVAKALLGEGKAVDDNHNRMAEIEHNFQHDKLALAHYNLKDCQLVWRIFQHTKLLPFILARGALTGIELDRLGGSVAAFTFRYLPLLHRAGFIAPDLTDSNIAPSPGGYVMDSVPGRFANVLTLDFKSLYPSIIRSFLIDPMGMVCGAIASEADRVEGFRGAYFHRTQHRLPQLVAELAELRELAKANQDLPLSQAIKILMNSFYGVLGAAGCRFHHPHLASSITLRGHQIMQQTKAWIEAEGYRVIYGDTDSTFVHVGDDLAAEQADAIGQRLVQLVNNNWTASLAAQGLTSALELEYESHYRHFFMPTIRGSQQGSKKRYVGAIASKIDNSFELVFKGMETVRSDWTPLARQFQKRLYQAWFNDQPIAPLIKQQVQQLLAGECDPLLIYKKRLRRPIADYQANAPHVRAAVHANQRLGREHYRRGSWVRYWITPQGAATIDTPGLQIDYQHYLDKQLAPIAEPLLQLQGLSVAQLLDQQLLLGL